jgi:hypothetical protein
MGSPHAWTERVPLRFAAEAGCVVRLREPTGADLLALDGVDTRAAARLLDRLLDGAADAAALAASDRDALLAALHRGMFSDDIVASTDCTHCGEPFDMAFQLSALQHQLEAERTQASVPAPRELVTADGATIRLPDAIDEEEAAGLGDEARARLVAHILSEGADETDLDTRLEALAPILDVDLQPACFRCGEATVIRFDIQSFVLQRLLDRREHDLSEVHALASGYGWSLAEILSLPTSLRQSLAQRLADARAAR